MEPSGRERREGWWFRESSHLSAGVGRELGATSLGAGGRQGELGLGTSWEVSLSPSTGLCVWWQSLSKAMEVRTRWVQSGSLQTLALGYTSEISGPKGRGRNLGSSHTPFSLEAVPPPASPGLAVSCSCCLSMVGLLEAPLMHNVKQELGPEACLLHPQV